MDRAAMRAVALLRTAGTECFATVFAGSVMVLADEVLSAMGLKCCCAIRADDPQVLETVVSAVAIDVIEDQSHLPSLPFLTLPA